MKSTLNIYSATVNGLPNFRYNIFMFSKLTVFTKGYAVVGMFVIMLYYGLFDKRNTR